MNIIDTVGESLKAVASEDWSASGSPKTSPPIGPLFPPKPEKQSLGFWTIAFAVLVGNIMTGIVGGIVYAAMH